MTITRPTATPTGKGHVTLTRLGRTKMLVTGVWTAYATVWPEPLTLGATGSATTTVERLPGGGWLNTDGLTTPSLHEVVREAWVASIFAAKAASR